MAAPARSSSIRRGLVRFPYLKYPVRGVGAVFVTSVYRPTVPIRLFGPAGDGLAYGLVDTGADDTILPDRFIKPLGVKIHPSDYANLAGIDDLLVFVRFGTLDLELSRPGVAYRWSATVAFYPGSKAILGHSGFLEHFTATFNGLRRHVTLTPNGTAPAATAPGR